MLCLAISVLFNTSALAEVTAHSAHSAHGTDHSMHSNMPMHGTEAATEAVKEEQAECHGEQGEARAEAEESDCVCAEVCCPSPLQFADSHGLAPLVAGSLDPARGGSRYLSITLDVVPPPPNVS